MIVWCIAFVCYASSHDDFVAVMSSEEKAKEAIDKLNAQYLVQIEDTKFPWGTPPYYYFQVDVSSWIFSDAKVEDIKEWEVVYTVPSVGKFQVYPKGCIVLERYALDEVKDE